MPCHGSDPRGKANTKPPPPPPLPTTTKTKAVAMIATTTTTTTSVIFYASIFLSLSPASDNQSVGRFETWHNVPSGAFRRNFLQSSKRKGFAVSWNHITMVCPT